MDGVQQGTLGCRGERDNSIYVLYVKRSGPELTRFNYYKTAVRGRNSLNEEAVGLNNRDLGEERSR